MRRLALRCAEVVGFVSILVLMYALLYCLLHVIDVIYNIIMITTGD